MPGPRAWYPLTRTTPSRWSSRSTAWSPSAARTTDGAGAPESSCNPTWFNSFDCNGAMGAMLFVDPEANEGTWLHHALEQEIAVVPDDRLASSVSELRAFVEQTIESMEIGELNSKLRAAWSESRVQLKNKASPFK